MLTSVANKDILCNISTALPSTDLNVMGGDIITIQGQKFPREVANNQITLKFSDGSQTECQVLKSAEL